MRKNPYKFMKHSKTSLQEGGQQGNNSGKMFHNYISASSMSARIKFDICNCADLASLHADDEDHQPNVGAQAKLDLNVPPTDDDCQADGDVTFAVPTEQNYFDLNLQASAQYEEMQKSMITDLCYSSMLFIIMHKKN